MHLLLQEANSLFSKLFSVFYSGTIIKVAAAEGKAYWLAYLVVK